MEIIQARTAGFCFGVKRSIEMAENLIEEKGCCLSLGKLIHNDDAIRMLESRGLRVINSPEEAGPGDTVIIRAHGEAPGIYERLRETGAEFIDATCPKVTAIHKIAERAGDNGRFVIIIGMKEHPEVTAVCGYCREYAVLENAKETQAYLKSRPEIAKMPVTVVVQTTQTKENFEDCINEIKKVCTNAEIFDTICLATSTRQEEAAQLSSKCDAAVVIGGKHSANSVHLAQICQNFCSNVLFIENADELDMSLLTGAKKVAVTAGASTPAWIIKEVRNKMSEEVKLEETEIEKELTFDEMLEETLKPIYNGDKVTGIVVGINGTEISLDLGTKYSGIIPTSEFTDAGEEVKEAVKVGDAIEAIVVRVNDVEGTATLSKKRLDATRIWSDLEEAVESGAVVEGVVTEENKGGVVVSVKGARVFVPASQTDLPRDAEMAELLKKTVKLKITEVNKARKRVVGSIKRAASAERHARTEAIWNEIEIGKKYTGTVKSLTSYGAFVDIGGIDGMVHVTELSWGRIHNPSEVVSVGDVIEVYVIGFDKEKRKISLGYKDPNGNPWAMFTEKYSVGDVASVKIVKLMEFGAFAEVVPDVDGLIHISQIANRRIAKPGEVLTVGDVVDAKIIAIDEEKQKISLSIRALSEPEAVEAPAEEESAEDALVYEISADGEAAGVVPEEEPAEE